MDEQSQHLLILPSMARCKPSPSTKNGDVILNGMNLFDPRQPFWRSKAPDIKYPE